MMAAAYGDDLHILQKLTSSGVDVTGIIDKQVSMCSYNIFIILWHLQFPGVQVTSYLY